MAPSPLPELNMNYTSKNIRELRGNWIPVHVWLVIQRDFLSVLAGSHNYITCTMKYSMHGSTWKHFFTYSECLMVFKIKPVFCTSGHSTESWWEWMWLSEAKTVSDWVWRGTWVSVASNKALEGQELCCLASLLGMKRRTSTIMRGVKEPLKKELISTKRGKVGRLNSTIYQHRAEGVSEIETKWVGKLIIEMPAL